MKAWFRSLGWQRDIAKRQEARRIAALLRSHGYVVDHGTPLCERAAGLHGAAAQKAALAELDTIQRFAALNAWAP